MRQKIVLEEAVLVRLDELEQLIRELVRPAPLDAVSTRYIAVPSDGKERRYDGLYPSGAERWSVEIDDAGDGCRGA